MTQVLTSRKPSAFPLDVTCWKKTLGSRYLPPLQSTLAHSFLALSSSRPLSSHSANFLFHTPRVCSSFRRATTIAHPSLPFQSRINPGAAERSVRPAIRFLSREAQEPEQPCSAVAREALPITRWYVSICLGHFEESHDPRIPRGREFYNDFACANTCA